MENKEITTQEIKKEMELNPSFSREFWTVLIVEALNKSKKYRKKVFKKILLNSYEESDLDDWETMKEDEKNQWVSQNILGNNQNFLERQIDDFMNLVFLIKSGGYKTTKEMYLKAKENERDKNKIGKS